jgi:SET domain-containing protein
MNVAIFWYITQCSPHMKQRFGRRYRLHLQDRKSATNCMLDFAYLIFYLEDDGDTFLRNVSSYRDYRALYPRRRQQQHSGSYNLFQRKHTDNTPTKASFEHRSQTEVTSISLTWEGRLTCDAVFNFHVCSALVVAWNDTDCMSTWYAETGMDIDGLPYQLLVSITN